MNSTLITQGLQKLSQNPWLAGVLKAGNLDYTLEQMHPTFSLTEIRAQVLEIVQETPTTKRFVLKANGLWTAGKPGQFVGVGVELNGRRTFRNYSLCDVPKDGVLSFAVKRQPGGAVSNHLHDHVQVGAILVLKPAAGDFTLDDAPEGAPLLMISGGSGITPVMGMIQQWKTRTQKATVVHVHTCTTPEEFIFASALQRLAQEVPEYQLHVHYSDRQGFITAQKLEQLCPDWKSREAFLCGPGPMMQLFIDHWHANDMGGQLRNEAFVAAPMTAPKPLGSEVAITFSSSGKTFTSQSSEPLLVQAEKAGLNPKHGCRIGICRSCQCVKKSGTVENLQTGEISDTPNELIRLCVTAARSDLNIEA